MPLRQAGGRASLDRTEFNEVGTEFNTVGKEFNTVGKEFNAVGREFNEVGTEFNAIGKRKGRRSSAPFRFIHVSA
jgi:hypothetical protein